MRLNSKQNTVSKKEYVLGTKFILQRIRPLSRSLTVARCAPAPPARPCRPARPASPRAPRADDAGRARVHLIEL